MIYELVIRLFAFGLRLAAVFHPKARKWVSGRSHWRQRYRADFQKKTKVLWVHAASLGEFEQGRPIIEGFREKFPGWQVVLTFFSPSGYEIRKNYPGADFICYLPADTRNNARDFVDLIQPDAAVFIKYEFWANYLRVLKNRQTPTLLVSALFRDGQPFFRWYGGFWRGMLRCFTHFFVQNEHSAALLRKVGLDNLTVAGDTRVDRVMRIAETAPDNAVVGHFAGQSTTTLIAGSTWPPDERLLLSVLGKPEFQRFKVVIAPHEPSDTHLVQLEKQIQDGPFSDRTRPLSLRYSQTDSPLLEQARYLLIDNVGMLNTLYRYGSVAYIGGGFGRGIHNTLEPAAWGLPVIFGPKYQKFEEARQLVARGGAFSVQDATELSVVLSRLSDPVFYKKAVLEVREYLAESRGATRRVLEYLEPLLGS